MPLSVGGYENPGRCDHRRCRGHFTKDGQAEGVIILIQNDFFIWLFKKFKHDFNLFQRISFQ